MWNTPRDERGSGGPILRDPLASRLRPYNNNANFNNRNANPMNNGNNFNDFGYAGDQPRAHIQSPSVFPRLVDETPFPPVNQFQLHLPPPPTPPPIPLNNFQQDIRQQEPTFPWSGGPPSFVNEFTNNLLNVPPPPRNLPAPSLLPILNNLFLNPDPGESSFDPLGVSKPQTLDLQPQWSVQNDLSESTTNKIPRMTLLGDDQQKFEFERRPFSSNHRPNSIMPPTLNTQEGNGESFYRRPFNDRQSQQLNNYVMPMPPPPRQQGPGKIPPLFESVPPLSYPRFNHIPVSRNYSNAPVSRNNSDAPVARNMPGSNQGKIPTLMTRSNSTGFNNKNVLKSNQQFNSRKPAPKVTVSSNNDNVVNLIPNKTGSAPLLATPKLVPYPPPPLHPKSAYEFNGPPPALPRNPKGILKNSNNSSYSNFVKEGSLLTSFSENSPAPVVPYQVGDDEDDEDDVELVAEVLNSKDTASSTTHDFFSEKMVQHFASILNGKTLDEQLDEFFKSLVLPADFLATRVSIVRNLHAMLRDKFKNSALQPYGADFIGIGNSDDSVNVFVDLTGKQGPSSQIDARVIAPSNMTRETVEELLDLIQEDNNHKFFGQIVRRTNYSFNQVTLPVISFIHSDTKVRCNLRLDNYLLVQEAKIIQFVCSLDTRIPSLLALARYWSSVHKVLDTPEEDTKNRFLTLMVLFFLARKKIIPTMAHIQSLSVRREYFNNLDIGFCDEYSLIPQNENPALEDKTVFTLSTLALLREFFKLFTDAKLNVDVVSLWKAEFIPKENFRPELECKLLQPDLRKRYRYGADGKLRNKRLDCNSRLCLQDFQDLSENLSLAVAEYDISKFQIECRIAHEKLDVIMANGSGNLMDLFVVSEYVS